MTKTDTFREVDIADVTSARFMELYNELRGENYCAELTETRFFKNPDNSVNGGITCEVVDGIGITSYIITTFAVMRESKTIVTKKFLRATKTEFSEVVYLQDNSVDVYASNRNNREFELV